MGHLKYKRKSSDGQDSARCTRLRPVSRVPLAGEKGELAGLLQESCQVKSREHITPSLLQLHWLPVYTLEGSVQAVCHYALCA